MSESFHHIFNEAIQSNPSVFEHWKKEKRFPYQKPSGKSIETLLLKRDITVVKDIIQRTLKKYESYLAHEEHEQQHLISDSGETSTAMHECREALAHISALSWTTLACNASYQDIKNSLIQNNTAGYTANSLIDDTIHEDISLQIYDMISSLKGGPTLVNPFEEESAIMKAFYDTDWTIPKELPRDITIETLINHSYIQALHEEKKFMEFKQKYLVRKGGRKPRKLKP